mmetsp:Transcript_5647/g.14667  ORF Transcript_5647/g.14667 Transcript_5647/m.14667 type:complete len:246 (-) Transcript_5647:44-781(-)
MMEVKAAPAVFFRPPTSEAPGPLAPLKQPPATLPQRPVALLATPPPTVDEIPPAQLLVPPDTVAYAPVTSVFTPCWTLPCESKARCRKLVGLAPIGPSLDSSPASGLRDATEEGMSTPSSVTCDSRRPRTPTSPSRCCSAPERTHATHRHSSTASGAGRRHHEWGAVRGVMAPSRYRAVLLAYTAAKYCPARLCRAPVSNRNAPAARSSQYRCTGGRPCSLRSTSVALPTPALLKRAAVASAGCE